MLSSQFDLIESKLEGKLHDQMESSCMKKIARTISVVKNIEENYKLVNICVNVSTYKDLTNELNSVSINKKSIFDNCWSYKNIGDAIYLQNELNRYSYKNVNLENLIFQNCKAKYSGGDIFIQFLI